MYFLRQKLIFILLALAFAIVGALLFEMAAKKAKLYENNHESRQVVNSFFSSSSSGDKRKSRISIGFQDKILHKWYQLIMFIMYRDINYFKI
ncbi:hypothetical protein [Candidatus Phytoplasma palmae]|uniref:hypothetical protein n=1 Tax=Candidatus Phytoplasma palmae TaxID=85624 RepID=UPI0039907E33